MAMQVQIRVRRDTAANWASSNPTLASGEIAFETDTFKLKVGTGTISYASLPYISGSGSGATTMTQLLDVLISSPSDGDVLSYDQSTGKWKNAARTNLTDGGNF